MDLILLTSIGIVGLVVGVIIGIVLVMVYNSFTKIKDRIDSVSDAIYLRIDDVETEVGQNIEEIYRNIDSKTDKINHKLSVLENK